MGQLPFWGRGRSVWRVQGPGLVVAGAQGTLASGEAEQTVEAARRLGFSARRKRLTLWAMAREVLGPWTYKASEPSFPEVPP